MTRSFYFVKDCPSIKISIHVSTSGEATTVIVKKKSGGVAEQLAASSSADGIIQTTDIGNGERLGDSVLDIVTIIELDPVVPQNLWESCFQNLIITYKVEGGIDGEQTFEYDNADKSRSDSKKTILVKQAIKMILVKQ